MSLKYDYYPDEHPSLALPPLVTTEPIAEPLAELEALRAELRGEQNRVANLKNLLQAWLDVLEGNNNDLPLSDLIMTTRAALESPAQAGDNGAG